MFNNGPFQGYFPKHLQHTSNDLRVDFAGFLKEGPYLTTPWNSQTCTETSSNQRAYFLSTICFLLVFSFYMYGSTNFYLIVNYGNNVLSIHYRSGNGYINQVTTGPFIDKVGINREFYGSFHFTPEG